jgi:hypothetical protein
MSFHGSQLNRGGRAVRRRRLVVEQRGPGGSEATIAFPAIRPGVGPSHKSDHYGEATFLAEQRRLIDLIPRRWLGFALLLVLGSAVIAALEALYARLPGLGAESVGSRLAAFDLAAGASLAGWFSSLTLLAATVVALLVYSVRRHKTDDYHGHYRLWLWAALCLFLMAADTGATLHQALQEMMTTAAGSRVTGDGSIWWLAPGAFMLVAMGSRLLIEMWSCRLSSAALLLTAACYATAGAVQLGWILPEGGADRVMLQQGTAMAGHLLLLLSVGLYARYVVLDAEGLLPRREAKPPGRVKLASDTVEGKEDASAASQWKTVDSPGTPQPVLKRVAPAAAAPVAAASTVAVPVKPAAPAPLKAAAPVSPKPVPAKPAPFAPAKPTAAVAAPAAPAMPQPIESSQQKLSKADRKELKKRLLQERLQREQKKAGNW